MNKDKGKINIRLENYESNIISEFNNIPVFNYYILTESKGGNTDIELVEFNKSPYKITKRKTIFKNLNEQELISELLRLNLIRKL